MNAKVSSVDLAARLLASENITVVRSQVSTASFDIKSRVLTLPQWKEMSPTVEGMLVGHEVGHALYTTMDYVEPLKENPKLKSYMNIIEDARIEKLMKREYPGIRKIMSAGYKELCEKDFFGLNKKTPEELADILLIDKINLYFKVGYMSHVSFTEEEKEFVERIEKVETIAEVIKLANEVYDYSLAQRKKNRSLNLDDLYGDAFVMTDDFSEQSCEEVKGDDGELGGPTGKFTPKDEDLEEDLKSFTDEEFESNLGEHVDIETSYVYCTVDENYVHDPIVSYKTVLADTADADATSPEFDRTFAKFKTDTNRVVGYLVKEFEMRKSATLYKRSQVSKSGSLDMSKIWSYKLNDDLFKTITSMPKGKNHGMIFMIDWSGSMDSVMEDTLEQVINLAMFCHRAQIPYQVFAFTTQYAGSDVARMKFYDAQHAFSSVNTNKLSNCVSKFNLLELFSSKMSNVELNTMVRRLYNYRPFTWCQNNQYGLGGTPLNEALCYMLEYIPKFRQSYNIEKMSFITLSDGAGGCLHMSGKGSLRKMHYLNGDYIKQKIFLSDPITKKHYEITENSAVQTDAILKMIKDRHGITTVGFYICSNSARVLRDAIRDNMPSYKGMKEDLIDRWREAFRKQGFASVKESGRDDLFIVPTNKLQTNNEELDITEDQSARQIAKNFTKVMSGNRTSRVLLNRFLEYVA